MSKNIFILLAIVMGLISNVSCSSLKSKKGKCADCPKWNSVYKIPSANI